MKREKSIRYALSSIGELMPSPKSAPITRSPRHTPGPAKRIALTVSLANKIEKHAVSLDRIVAICVLLPLYIGTITVTYRSVECVWDDEHSPMAWAVVPLSIAPVQVMPVGLALRLPFIWEPLTKNCLHKHCAPSTSQKVLYIYEEGEVHSTRRIFVDV